MTWDWKVMTGSVLSPAKAHGPYSIIQAVPIRIRGRVR